MRRWRFGQGLNHPTPILADANCTLMCIYLSIVSLIASGVYQLTGIGFVASLGTIGLIDFTINIRRRVA